MYICIVVLYEYTTYESMCIITLMFLASIFTSAHVAILLLSLHVVFFTFAILQLFCYYCFSLALLITGSHIVLISMVGRLRRTRTVYLGERNKGLSSTFQPSKEGRSVQQPKRCDNHGDKAEENSPKNVNNVHKLVSYYLPF